MTKVTYTLNLNAVRYRQESYMSETGEFMPCIIISGNISNEVYFDGNRLDTFQFIVTTNQKDLPSSISYYVNDEMRVSNNIGECYFFPPMETRQKASSKAIETSITVRVSKQMFDHCFAIIDDIIRISATLVGDRGALLSKIDYASEGQRSKQSLRYKLCVISFFLCYLNTRY